MAVTSGFYDSDNGDRKYNMKDLSSIFDGVIIDGIFQGVEDGLAITPAGGLNINLGAGRAWFNHAWVRNDGIEVMTADPADVLQARYDMIIIEINHTRAIRNGFIKFLKGDPNSSPVYPSMSTEQDVYQYPMFAIYRPADTDEILTENITDLRGTPECPYASGVLNVNATINSLKIVDGITPNEVGVVNIIPYPDTGPTPDLVGIPNGTLFVKYKNQ